MKLRKTAAMLQAPLGTDSVRVASSVDSSVGVVFFGVYASIVDDELERVVHEAPAAPGIVRPVAVDKLLLGQRDQLASHNLVYALHGSDG